MPFRLKPDGLLILPSKFPGRHICPDGMKQGNVRLPLEGFDVITPGAGTLGLWRGAGLRTHV